MLINKRRTGWKKREAAKAEAELRGGGRWEVGETEEDACARYSNSSSTWPASGQCAHPGPVEQAWVFAFVSFAISKI